MLESHGQLTLDQILERLEDRIQLPSEWGAYFLEAGALPPKQHDDRRRFVRHRYRTRAVLELQQTLPTVERREPYHCIYMRDLSRNGCSFLHHAQLYPGEDVRLWLGQQRLRATVLRCIRRNDRCFVIGAAVNALQPAQ